MVKVIDERIVELLDDMKDTMYEQNGVGLAAVQVGVLKRIFIVDTGGYLEDEDENGEPIGEAAGPPEESNLTEFINPEIVECSGEDDKEEGCLSVPKKYGRVIRPAHIIVRATDRTGAAFELEATDMFARAIAHEMDHLDGILFIDKMLPKDDEDEDDEQ